MVRIVLFVVGSVALTGWSWASVKSPRSHGFYRWLGWECVLALILLNIDSWFDRPLSFRQWVSWILLVGSAGLAVEGVRLLRRAPRSGTRREATDLFEFERTTGLVTTGIYRFIRHPMYASLLYLTWGSLLKDPTFAASALALAATGLFVATALVEERENLEVFGEAYARYRSRTRRFIPFVW